MKKILLAALLALMPGLAFAQVVTKLPVAVIANGGAVTDLGNGPAELLVAQGSVQLFTSQGSGVGTATTTALTLTATPATPPIVGGLITCNVATACSIPANTTVTAFNGTTGVTLSATATITAAQVNWGAACPAAIGTSFPVLNVQAPSSGLPLFTQARICAASQYAAGGLILPFSIGAH